eukprot:Awhi_evm1s6205
MALVPATLLHLDTLILDKFNFQLEQPHEDEASSSLSYFVQGALINDIRYFRDGDLVEVRVPSDTRQLTPTNNGSHISLPLFLLLGHMQNSRTDLGNKIIKSSLEDSVTSKMEPPTETEPHLSIQKVLFRNRFMTCNAPTCFDGSTIKEFATFLKAFVLLHGMGKQYATEKAAMQTDRASSTSGNHANIAGITLCRSCDSEQHLRAECPHLNDTCSYCDKKGHIEQACFAKKRGDLEREMTSLKNKLENTLLLGLISGPEEPKGNINNYLSLFKDNCCPCIEMALPWKCHVKKWPTGAKRKNSVPKAADCTYELYFTNEYGTRTYDEGAKPFAEIYRNAKSDAATKRAFTLSKGGHGVQYSVFQNLNDEFLELSFWDVCRIVLVDAMHCLYL